MDLQMIVDAHDSTLWRIERLQKTIKVACAILGITKQQLEAMVYSIRDQKGELFVLWNHPWTKRQEQAFQTAWELGGETNVHHDSSVF